MPSHAAYPRQSLFPYATEADAKAAAQAEQNRLRRGQATLDLNLALGRPDIFPDRRAMLTGFPKPIQERTWLVSETTHSIDGTQGLRTTLRLETA